jgi:hypothetical protein
MNSREEADVCSDRGHLSQLHGSVCPVFSAAKRWLEFPAWCRIAVMDAVAA